MDGARVVQICVATKNQGKVCEFREMLGSDRLTWTDLSTHAEIETVEETGHTFRANACLKASHYARALNMWALADDSGLAVDALDGKPGVHSARWAEMHDAGKGDAANNALLLKQLDELRTHEEAPTARFLCVLALSDPLGRIILTAQDSVEGALLRAPRGTNGFGYDPLFLVPVLDKSMAELSPGEKHQISHRGKALRSLKQLMRLMSKQIGD